MRNEFRSLLPLGLPDYEIDRAGNVRRKGRTRLLKPRHFSTFHAKYYQGVVYQLRQPDPHQRKYTLRTRRRLVALMWGKRLLENEFVLSVDFTDHIESLVAVSASDYHSHCRKASFSLHVWRNKLYVAIDQKRIHIPSARPLCKEKGWIELLRRSRIAKHPLRGILSE